VGTLSLQAIIRNRLFDPLRRRLQVDRGQQYHPADDYEGSKDEGDSKKRGHRENLICRLWNKMKRRPSGGPV
jgi:hypothetical protein